MTPAELKPAMAAPRRFYAEMGNRLNLATRESEAADFIEKLKLKAKK